VPLRAAEIYNGLNFTVRKPDFVLKRMMLNFMGYSLPRQLFIGVTYSCQCRCVHCNVSAFKQAKDNELSAPEIKKIIGDAKRYRIPKIVFFGGEPLLREDLAEFISYAASIRLEPSIFTNGILLDDAMIGKLKKAGLAKCNVSLDSSRPEVHDRYRGYEGCFEKAAEGVRKLGKAGIRCTIWTIASKEDAANDLVDLKRLIESARGWGAHNVMVLFPMAAGNWEKKSESEILLSREEREKVRKLYDPPFVCMEFPREDTRCVGGRRFIYIDPKGTVSPCPSIPNSLGNIRRESFDGMLRNFRKDTVPKTCMGECAMNKCGLFKKEEAEACRDVGYGPKAPPRSYF